jgi:PD-(D/E)XK nuclease superfamily
VTIYVGAEEREIGVSWSRLRDHMECHQKAALKAKGKKAPSTDIRNFFPGTVVDVCMRRWLDQDSPQIGEMTAMLDQVLVDAEHEAQKTGDGIVRWRHLGDRDEVRASCRELLERLEPILCELALDDSLDYVPARRFRAPLVVPYLDGSPQRIWLVGEMDLFTQTRSQPCQYRVWDLKNTRNKDYWRKVTGQLLFYDLATFCLHGSWTSECGLIQPLCPERVLRFVFAEQNRRELLAAVTRYAADVWRNDQAPKATNEGCDRCEVRHACVRYASSTGRVAWPAA